MKIARILFTVQETAKKINEDKITAYAAQTCYYLLLSFMPFIIALINIIHYFPVTSSDLLDLLENIIPQEFHPMLINIFTDIESSSSVALLSLTAIGLLWSAGKGFMTIKRCLNKINNCEYNRSWFIQRIFSSLYALILLLSIAASLLIIVFGEHLIAFLQNRLASLGGKFTIINAIFSNRLFLVPALLTLFFSVMYTFIPNKKKHIIEEIPGAFIASIGWFLFSELYSLYITYIAKYSYTYGSLTTFMLLLIWMYICIIILFFGAEFNTLIEKNIFKPFHITGRNKITTRK
ncbi:MAG: YihY/virulence factor BrkB family protein [Lachnospira sp.]|nr:YihY/virulence factor BrkB family protein [Lachnospira sp.]HCH83020.1 hypothetical protein [Eubacterium sp.]